MDFSAAVSFGDFLNFPSDVGPEMAAGNADAGGRYAAVLGDAKGVFL